MCTQISTFITICSILIELSLLKHFPLILQGRPGEKGQKGENGSPGFDMYAAVKVSLILHIWNLRFR